jgi:hypothetical protein
LIEMNRYLSLLNTFVEVDLDTHCNLTPAILSLPEPGVHPSPWAVWTLINLINYGARKRWAYDMIRSRVIPQLFRRPGGDMALELLCERWFVPGLPEWECLLDGIDTLVRNRVSGEQIHVDLVGGPGVFSGCQLAGHFQSFRHPGPAAQRLLELHPSCRAVRLAVNDLIDAGMIHPVDDIDFELCAAARKLNVRIAAFLDAWQDPKRRPWLAALIGDWPAAHAAAKAVGDPGLLALTEDRARKCHQQWLEYLRERISSKGLDDESLHALAEAGAADLPDYLREALGRPEAVALAALELIDDDPGYVPLVAELFSRSPEGPLPDLLGGRCALYLARHGHRTRAMLDWLGSPDGRYLGRAVELAIEHAPDMALPLIRRSLRSTTSTDRVTAAAVLALVDRPWSHSELCAVLDESDSQDKTIECRAALRESSDAAGREIADAWEWRNTASDEHPELSNRSIEGGLLDRMRCLRDLVLCVRDHISPVE